MKNMRKLFALVLALVMVMSLATTAFADEAATSTITIQDSATVKVDGRAFAAYRILDMQNVGESGKIYTVPAGMEDFYEDEFGLTADSADFDYEVTQKIAAMGSNSEDLFDFAQKALAAAKAANLTKYEATGANGEAKFENLPLGYYVIDDLTDPAANEHQVVSALILDSTTGETVTIKADLPSIDKNIDGDEDTDPETKELVKYNNTSINDNVPFVLNSTVPVMTDYKSYTYKVTDVMSKGLTFNNDVKVTIDGSELIKETDYTVSSNTAENGETTLNIEFKKFLQWKEKAGKAIQITYSATVNQNAVIGIDGNPNKVTLIYSNDPDDSTSMGVTPESVTRTYVTEVELIKVDSNNNVLADATFTLEGNRVNHVLITSQEFEVAEDGTHWKLKAGTYTTVDPASEGADQNAYESITTKYKIVTKEYVDQEATNYTVTATTGPDGKIKFTGLAAGEYTITEIKAPAGYNKLDTPITLIIGWEAPDDGETVCEWTYTWAAEEEGTDDLIKSENNTTAQITVVNKAGLELPSTGGMGTTLFYVVGGLMVLAATVLLVTKKRMTAE